MQIKNFSKMVVRFKPLISQLRPCHTIAYRTSVCQRMKNITHTPVYTLTYARGMLGIRCIRFKHGHIRWHTLAYAEAENFF
jgi:hypothetical protein